MTWSPDVYIPEGLGMKVELAVGDGGVFRQMKQKPVLADLRGAYPRRQGLSGMVFEGGKRMYV